MRKTISIFLAALLVLCLAPLTNAAGSPTGGRTDLTFTYPLAHPTYFVTASVEKLNGNQNRLTITITEFYPDGTEKVITESFMINNNAAGTYKCGIYNVYVDTKGNTDIRKIYIVT